MRPLLPADPREVGGFVLDARLGVGGMGVVFHGIAADGTPAAVKLVREELAADDDFRTRFRREVRAARAVGGACTAKVLAADADADRPWLATEFVDGPTLHDVVTRHGPLPADVARALAAGLAESLAAIHAAGVVHRDLKPANVILGDQGPKVIDFGIAALADATSATRSGIVVGSPGYMSPEQITGTGTGPPTDVFAWGLTVTFAATGRPPYGTTERAEALLYRVVHGSPDLAGLPAALDGPVRAAVAPDPAHRPAPDDLLRLLLPEAPDPYRAATTALREVWPGVAALRAPVTPRRRTALTVVVGVLAGLVVGGGVGFWWLAGPGAGAAPTPVAQPVASTTPAPTTTPLATTTPAPAPSRPVPRFVGFADTTDEAAAMGQFLRENDARVVYIEVVQTSPERPDPAYDTVFVVTEEYCGGDLGCAGTQMNLIDVGPATDSAYEWSRGDTTLRGNFAVTVLGYGIDYLMVNLRAVPESEATG